MSARMRRPEAQTQRARGAARKTPGMSDRRLPRWLRSARVVGHGQATTLAADTDVVRVHTVVASLGRRHGAWRPRRPACQVFALGVLAEVAMQGCAYGAGAELSGR